jgi:hypothetical protein
MKADANLASIDCNCSQNIRSSYMPIHAEWEEQFTLK